MSIFDCLDEAVRGGELEQAEADRLKRDYERFRARREATGEPISEEQARLDMIEAVKADTAHKRKKARLALNNLREIENDFFTFRRPDGKADIANAALFKLEHFGSAPFSSVAGRKRSILAQAHGKMESLLYHFRRGALRGDKLGGRWNQADQGNVLRAAFGEHTDDDAARGMAKTWYETHEWLRKRFNAAGGNIGKLENWGLPQHHDSRALRKATLPVWKEEIRPLLDVKRMTSPLTGQPIDASELDEILDGIFWSITTDGWIDRDPLRRPFGRGALANQRQEHRFLVFRNAEAWLDYQSKFGGGADVFAAMMGHINMMSRDIAAMEVLGPNPSGTVELMKQTIRKEGELAAAGKRNRLGVAPERALDRAASMEKRISDVWASIRGETETPVNSRAANVMGAARSLITSSVLGSAAISSLSDVGTSYVARKFAGLSTAGTVTDIVKQFGRLERREAVRAGLILDSAAHVFHTQARYVGTLNGPEWAAYISDRVLTWSGLTPWTQAAKHAFGLDFQGEMAGYVKTGFSDLPDALRGTLERWGLTSREWDRIRTAPLHRRDGAAFLRPNEIAERIDPKLADRYIEMILGETDFAVPDSSHRSKTALRDNTRPGTFIGETVRSFSQFKSFPATILMLHGMRTHAMLAGGLKREAAAYAGSLLISTTLFGAASLQLKQVVAGRDPKDMTEPAFWGAAMMQGGALGIYGDFLFSDINRYGGGFATTLAGPVVSRANDFWNLTAGNAIQLATGEKTHFGRELVRFARQNTPGANIWYLRLAFEREVFDQLQFLLDPEANKAFKRTQQTWARDYGQDFFWPPGDLAPARSPRLSAAAGL